MHTYFSQISVFVGFVQDHEDCNFCSMLRLTIAGLDTMTPEMALAAPDTADGHSPNWTDVISIQAEWTRKNLITWHCIYCVLISPQLGFLPEELLYYKQSSSNEKFLARACFQDILCRYIGITKVATRLKIFFFCFLQINVNRGIITRIIYFISIWIEMSWALGRQTCSNNNKE